MLGDDFLEEKVCHNFCCCWFSRREESGHFTEPIDDHQDTGVS